MHARGLSCTRGGWWHDEEALGTYIQVWAYHRGLGIPPQAWGNCLAASKGAAHIQEMSLALWSTKDGPTRFATAA